MDKLLENAPRIIEAAAKSALGVFALMVLALAALGFLLFDDASEPTRAAIFVLLLLGVAAFGVAAVRSAPGPGDAEEGGAGRTPPVTGDDGPAAATPPLSLRRSPATVTGDELEVALVRHGLWEKHRNPAGRGAGSTYRTEVRDDAVVVVDERTGLMWQKGGSDPMTFDRTGEHVARLNAERFAGHDGWRVPTVEETLSLMTPDAPDDFHFDRAFGRGAPIQWTADRAGEGRVWVAYFSDGRVLAESEAFNASVRAVRGV